MLACVCACVHSCVRACLCVRACGADDVVGHRAAVLSRALLRGLHLRLVSAAPRFAAPRFAAPRFAGARLYLRSYPAVTRSQAVSSLPCACERPRARLGLADEVVTRAVTCLEGRRVTCRLDERRCALIARGL